MAANILVTVSEASGREVAAKRDLEAAIVQAHSEGHSNRAIAGACHLSHERVRQIVNAAKPQLSEQNMEARLAELDARWDGFVAQLAERFMPDEPTRKREQGYRNVENARAKRQASGKNRNGSASGASAWKSTVRPTVTVEVRRFAETYALRYLEEHSTLPVCVKILGELNEAAALREQLAAIVDARVPFLHD